MDRKRALRIILTVAGVLALLAVVVVIIVLMQLPSVTEVRNAVRSVRRPVVIASRGVPRDTASESGTTAATDAAPAPAPSPTPASPALSEDDLVTSYLVSRYVERGDSTVNVCNNLNEIRGQAPTNRAQFMSALQNDARLQLPVSPFVESALAPVGAMLSQPSVSAVIAQFLDASATQDESLITKADFYSQLAFAASELVSNRLQYQVVSQASYQLYALSRAVALNPSLANDGRTQDVCTRFQNLASSTTNVQSEEQLQTLINQEKLALLAYLGEVGITPGQVGFDPALPPTVEFQVSLQRVGIRIPWMERQIGTSISLRNPLASPTPATTPAS